MKQEILQLLKNIQCVSLATCEGDCPRVRPMTMIFFQGRFFFATGATDNKAAQLQANPNSEFMLLIPGERNTGYLRGSGKMQPIGEVGLKKEVADWAPFIYDYFNDPADPGYVLYELIVAKMGYMKPGDMYETTIEW